MTDDDLRKFLTEKLELPADSDDDTIMARLDEKMSQAAEHTVAASIRTGKILAAHRDYWLAAFKSDYHGTKAVLDSLAAPAASLTAVPTMPPDLAAPKAVAPARPKSFAEAQAALKAPLNDDETNAALWKLAVRGATPPPSVIGPTLPGWES